jgi:hypothetical protein
VAKVPLLRMETVMRSDEMKGFVVLPRRWVVERTFSWFGRNRRLAKDFENLAETMGAFVALASIQLALKAACQDVDRRRNKPTVCIALTVKVCKSDCEGTVAGTRGNGEVAPKPAIPRGIQQAGEFEPQSAGCLMAGLGGTADPTETCLSGAV